MCLSLALVCSEVDGIVVIYLWPPSFAYSKILTRGRYLSRHSRCLRAVRYCKRFSRQAPWFSRSIATNSLRDGCPHAVVPTETTSSQPPEAPPSHARRRQTPPSAAAPRPSFRPWTPWAALLFAAASAQTASLLGGLVGGAGQGSWGLSGVGEGVLGTARFRLCAPWLPFLCLAAAPTVSRGRTLGRR